MRKLIIEIGRALHGDYWQTPMGEEIGVSARGVRRWAAGELEPDPDRLPKIEKVIEKRIAELTKLLARLRKAMKGDA